MRRIVVFVCLALSVGVARAADRPCAAATGGDAPCACDVRTLHPLQGAVGRDEVRHKAEAIADHPKKARKALARDPILVVRGPDDGLFILDHHHAAAAWAMAGEPMALCRIVPRPPFATAEAFWSGLVADRLVRLADQDGRSLAPDALPASVADLPDDPYRSLAWRLRKAGGFCRAAMAQREFAEFLWADWLRRQPALPEDAVRRAPKTLLAEALALARSPAAAGLPGFVGDKPDTFACPDD